MANNMKATKTMKASERDGERESERELNRRNIWADGTNLKFFQTKKWKALGRNLLNSERMMLRSVSAASI